MDSLSTFDEMKLNDKILRGIYGMGLEKPSSIQQRAIPQLLTKRDLIAQSQSGTGKTATFSIGLLELLDVETNTCQALVLEPTRELAIQTENVIKELSKYVECKTHVCVGGNSVRNDIDIIKNGVHVVVGTPGRIFHMLRDRYLDITSLKLLILDEADQILDRGFKEQLYDIFRYIPQDAQIGLFSATMPQDALDITKKFMKDPEHLLVKTEELTLEGIKQYYIALEREEWKIDTLCDIYEAVCINQAIIFANTRKKVDWIAEKLTSRDFTVSCIHGDLNQQERDNILDNFRSGNCRVLISTDILGRGIDIQTISLVINYDFPQNRENYIHRIGRSGRFGRKGVAINLILKHDVQYMRDIEAFYQTEVQELPADLENIF